MKDQLVLTVFQGCLAILQTDISVEQTRQGKHLRSLKSGDAAEEIHGGKPSRGKTSDLRTVENHANTALPQVRTERSCCLARGARQHQIGNINPVGFAAVKLCAGDNR